MLSLWRFSRTCLLVLGWLIPTLSRSHEGMWLPTLLNMEHMQSMGLKLTAEDIYDVNHGSLKDAIVHFGGGCTGEMISDQGLLLTNYHCGYSQVQSHSSLENDYLTEGFWAMNKEEELANPGLTVTFIRQIIQVTDEVLENIDQNTPEEERQGMIQANALDVINAYKTDSNLIAQVVAFDYGNSYFLFLKEEYSDVRLVGAPPGEIGKFGGDTDNWVWPRHTGDFSLFRVYADANGRPAAYSEDNVPLQPRHHLPINLNGLEEGDFTMVYGFPGRTYEYIHHKAVEFIVKESNPLSISMRKKTLSIMDHAMDQDPEVKIKYAAKQSRVSNAYKKWIGQSQGLEAYKAVDKKIEFEKEFLLRLHENDTYSEAYASLLDDLEKNIIEGKETMLGRKYFIEFYYYGPEVLQYASGFKSLHELLQAEVRNEEAISEELAKLKKRKENFFKNYEVNIDKQVFEALWMDYYTGMPQKYAFRNTDSKLTYDNASVMADQLYTSTLFSDASRVDEFLSLSHKKMLKTLLKDPGYNLAQTILETYSNTIRPDYTAYQKSNELLMRSYTFLQHQLYPDKPFWPDANSTLRITYGKMEGSSPRDGMKYTSTTTLDGIIQKSNTGEKDFRIPGRLRTLWENKEYGRYAVNGTVPVCFLGSNHTSGGNSGSPALDKDGYLVGLNFDRTWESTMSDIMFNPEICRNIMVDMRYVLFVIDIYAGAGHLVEEMTLIPMEQR
jgi:hypothetical protein